MKPEFHVEYPENHLLIEPDIITPHPESLIKSQAVIRGVALTYEYKAIRALQRGSYKNEILTKFENFLSKPISETPELTTPIYEFVRKAIRPIAEIYANNGNNVSYTIGDVRSFVTGLMIPSIAVKPMKNNDLSTAEINSSMLSGDVALAKASTSDKVPIQITLIADTVTKPFPQSQNKNNDSYHITIDQNHTAVGAIRNTALDQLISPSLDRIYEHLPKIKKRGGRYKRLPLGVKSEIPLTFKDMEELVMNYFDYLKNEHRVNEKFAGIITWLNQGYVKGIRWGDSSGSLVVENANHKLQILRLKTNINTQIDYSIVTDSRLENDFTIPEAERKLYTQDKLQQYQGGIIEEGKYNDGELSVAIAMTQDPTKDIKSAFEYFSFKVPDDAISAMWVTHSDGLLELASYLGIVDYEILALAIRQLNLPFKSHNLNEFTTSIIAQVVDRMIKNDIPPEIQIRFKLDDITHLITNLLENEISSELFSQDLDNILEKQDKLNKKYEFLEKSRNKKHEILRDV